MAQPTVTALQRLKKESATDSDWSSNKEHRRSTSAGIHLINGFYMFGSSRTQRTVSLSSCEAELHGMVSTLADGIYIRRCLSFLTGADVSHYLLTGRSSAFFFRPTPSWLPPGRYTCSIAAKR